MIQRFRYKILVTWLVLSGASLELFSGDAIVSSSRRWAILIGVDEYDSQSITGLRYCVRDVRLLGRTLSESCQYNSSDVLSLHSGAEDPDLRPTLHNMSTWIRFVLKRVKPEDSVLVFFSGHGLLDDKNRGFLLPSNVDPARFEETALATTHLRNMLAMCRARQKLLILDCCHAGGKGIRLQQTGYAFPGAEAIGNDFKQANNLLTLASCRASEKSFEWPAKGQGLFTYYLARGLQGDADERGDGVVNTAELYSYLRDKVTTTAKTKLRVNQTPTQIVAPGEVPVFGVALVEKKTFFEDFVNSVPGLLPGGWQGKGLTVQSMGAGNALQMRGLGSGVVTLPRQKIHHDFFLECAFHTHGYVNKKRSLELLLADRKRRPRIRVSIDDRYPNLVVAVNGRRFQPRTNLVSDSNRLELYRRGRSLEVKLNGTPIHATNVESVPLPIARLSLGNNRDEYGRADTARFPTVHSIRIGPIE